MNSVNRTDVRDLLAVIAAQDGREITDLAIDAWAEQATDGNWSRDTALATARDFYARQPQPCWNGTTEPRPLLPADIHRRR